MRCHFIKQAVVLLALAGSYNAFCQLTAEGDVKDYIFNRIPALPKSGANNYQNPTPSDLGVWAQAINNVWNGDLADAQVALEAIDYRIVEFTNTADNKTYYIFEKSPSGENYWGIYVFNLEACRSQLVIQSPHPVYDTNTGYQGMHSFLELDAGAFFLSGTHRCNSSTTSGCSGTTSTCGSSGPFSISDPAHNADGVFQRLTGIMLARNPESVFVQFHGFGKRNGDPNAILSNGSRATPDEDYIDDLIFEMTADIPSATFKTAHKDSSWDRLLAFTNTQGRLINGSSDPCTIGASVGNGHFIHIEQEKDFFRNDQSGWDKWIGPMSRVFECVEEKILSVSGREDCEFFPNPFTESVSFVGGNELVALMVFNTAGQQVYHGSPDNWLNVDLSFLEDGVYIFQAISKDGQSLPSGRLIKR